jgi:hypothetical protein
MYTRILVAVFLLAVTLGATAGCQQVRRMAGITTTIDSPDDGSPEALVRDVLSSAIESDESKGWEAYRKLLHSEQLLSRASEKAWRTMNYPALRRKVRLYLEDDAVPTYELAYIEEVAPSSVKLFVSNEKSEVPTPCTLKPDANHGGAWRITLCSL